MHSRLSTDILHLIRDLGHINKFNRRTVNPYVAGSSPAAGANQIGTLAEIR